MIPRTRVEGNNAQVRLWFPAVHLFISKIKWEWLGSVCSTGDRARSLDAVDLPRPVRWALRGDPWGPDGAGYVAAWPLPQSGGLLARPRVCVLHRRLAPYRRVSSNSTPLCTPAYPNAHPGRAAEALPSRVSKVMHVTAGRRLDHGTQTHSAAWHGACHRNQTGRGELFALTLQLGFDHRPMFDHWKLWLDLLNLGYEAQRVIAMRLERIAAGGRSADAECRRMVSEKFEAAAAARAATIAALATGKGIGGAAGQAVAIIQKSVRSNHRRLSWAKRFGQIRLAVRRVGEAAGLVIQR